MHPQDTAFPFAHPFLSRDHHAPQAAFHGARRMRDAVKATFEPVPILHPDPVWTLADVVGAQRAQAIEASGSISFHAVGDTGAGKFPTGSGSMTHFGVISHDVEESQVAVAKAMNDDLDFSHPATTPAFFFHLGDVIYFDNTPTGYHEQFYVPYQSYGGKIIAIPGNHDGEVFLGHQRSTLVEFMKNFCQAAPGVPQDASPVIRQMSAQPGVFWWLQAPFADIIGLYSNCGEGPGALRGAIPGDEQYAWFQSALHSIAASRHGAHAAGKKALIVATHHPGVTAGMFGQSGGHSPSEEMKKDMDDAFEAAGVWPELILSAHDHNYQRFTRTHNGKKTAYVVAGGGGRQPQTRIETGRGQVNGEFTYDHSHIGHGYLLVKASAAGVKIDYHPVPGPDPANKDTFTVALH